MKGLLVFVHKMAGGDCTANGITNNFVNLLLVGEGVEGPFEPKPDEPHLKLIKRKLYGKERYHAVPVNFPRKGCGPMFGGNFVYTSDSRFPCDYPIPVHDRYES